MSIIKVKVLIQVSGDSEDSFCRRGLPPPISAELTLDRSRVDIFGKFSNVDEVKEIVYFWWRQMQKTLPDKLVEMTKEYLSPDVKFHDISVVEADENCPECEFSKQLREKRSKISQEK